MKELVNKYKKHLAVFVLLLAALYTSYWYGKQSNPPETIVKIEEKVREKIITVEVERKSEKKNSTTKITEKPDGTKETVITENSESISESSTKSKADKETESKTEIVTKNDKLSKYRLGIMAESKVLDREKRSDLMYSANGSMRVFGPWWLDAKVGWTEKSVGLGVSVEF